MTGITKIELVSTSTVQGGIIIFLWVKRGLEITHSLCILIKHAFMDTFTFTFVLISSPYIRFLNSIDDTVINPLAAELSRFNLKSHSLPQINNIDQPGWLERRSWSCCWWEAAWRGRTSWGRGASQLQSSSARHPKASLLEPILLRWRKETLNKFIRRRSITIRINGNRFKFGIAVPDPIQKILELSWREEDFASVHFQCSRGGESLNEGKRKESLMSQIGSILLTSTGWERKTNSSYKITLSCYFIIKSRWKCV